MLSVRKEIMFNLKYGIMENLSEEKKEINVTTSDEQTVNLKFRIIFKWALAVLGLVFIMYGGYMYSQDLGYSSNPMDFHEERYVGGDAYNYIISASRSAAVMIKSLIWFVLGCTSIIISRTIHNIK